MYKTFVVQSNGIQLEFSPMIGWLRQKKGKQSAGDSSPKLAGEKLKNFEAVKNPYLVNPIPISSNQKFQYKKWLASYAVLLINLHRHAYPLLWLLSHLRLNFFDTAQEACEFFCTVHPHQQNLLCLPRSVFAATTSRRFRDYGIMVVGAFLPARRMHAWVMEDGRNAYLNDDIWINYQPVALML